jgi:hypothetical protein
MECNFFPDFTTSLYPRIPDGFWLNCDLSEIQRFFEDQLIFFGTAKESTMKGRSRRYVWDRNPQMGHSDCDYILFFLNTCKPSNDKTVS